MEIPTNTYNAALRCDARLPYCERNEIGKRKESLLNACKFNEWLSHSSQSVVIDVDDGEKPNTNTPKIPSLNHQTYAYGNEKSNHKTGKKAR